MKLNYYRINSLTETELNEQIKICNFKFLPVSKLDENDFYSIFQSNMKRYSEEYINNDQLIEEKDVFKLYSAMINAICNPKSVNSFKLNYLSERK